MDGRGGAPVPGAREPGPGARGPGADPGDRRSALAGEPAGDGRLGVLVDVLGLGVLLEAGGAELAPEPGHLEAAPLRLRQVGVVVVDPDRAVAQCAGDPVRGMLKNFHLNLLL